MRLLPGLLSLLLVSAPACFAFSLLGPFDTWQTADIGYGVNEVRAEIGGPMNKDEGYRWNVQVITYGFDPTFVKFFGKKGMDEVNKAIAVFNSLPRFSKMSSNLSEYPLSTLKFDYYASSLGLIDLKSAVMGVLTEELGLANPHNFVWTLRDKVAITGGGFSYQVIMRNFDPANGQHSRHINGVLYSYRVLDPVPGFNTAFADAVDFPIDPFAPLASSVAAFFSQYDENMTWWVGGYFTGLTRDDVGGLRHLYSSKNRAVEGLPPGTLGDGGGGVWTPVTATNVFVDVAVRPGVDRIVLRQLKFDAGGLGGFTAVTNRMTDTYINAQNRQVKQGIGRPLSLPDIVFSAADLNRNDILRTDTANWVNYATTNSPGGGGTTITGGPGIIVPPVTVTFNKIGPSLINQYSGNSFFLDEGDGSRELLWGVFDGSTNTPFIFPVDNNGNSYPIQELEQAIFGGLL